MGQHPLGNLLEYKNFQFLEVLYVTTVLGSTRHYICECQHLLLQESCDDWQARLMWS